MLLIDLDYKFVDHNPAPKSVTIRDVDPNDATKEVTYEVILDV